MPNPEAPSVAPKIDHDSETRYELSRGARDALALRLKGMGIGESAIPGLLRGIQIGWEEDTPPADLVEMPVSLAQQYPIVRGSLAKMGFPEAQGPPFPSFGKIVVGLTTQEARFLVERRAQGSRDELVIAPLLNSRVSLVRLCGRLEGLDEVESPHAPIEWAEVDSAIAHDVALNNSDSRPSGAGWSVGILLKDPPNKTEDSQVAVDNTDDFGLKGVGLTINDQMREFEKEAAELLRCGVNIRPLTPAEYILLQARTLTHSIFPLGAPTSFLDESTFTDLDGAAVMPIGEIDTYSQPPSPILRISGWYPDHLGSGSGENIGYRRVMSLGVKH